MYKPATFYRCLFLESFNGVNKDERMAKTIKRGKGVNPGKAGSEAYINRAYYSQIEIGVRNPSFEVAAKISETLGGDPARFFISKGSEPFGAALKNAPIIIAHCDLNLRYTWFHQPCRFRP